MNDYSALEHVEKLSPEQQEKIAQLIEEKLKSLDIPQGSSSGSKPDMPDDTEMIA